MRSLRTLTLGCLVLTSTGCGTTYVTRGSTEPVRPRFAASSPDAVFGRTVRVTMSSVRIYGELIACDRAGIYLRVHERGDAAWRRIDWRENPSVDVALPSFGPAFLGWSIAGTVSTLSHGFYSIITAPIWALVGSITSATAWSPHLGLASCEVARPYARFPQGLPSSFAGRFEGRFDENGAARETPVGTTASAPSSPEPPSLPAPWDATPTTPSP
jgi:hypothetical protein